MSFAEKLKEIRRQRAIHVVHGSWKTHLRSTLVNGYCGFGVVECRSVLDL